MSDLTELILSHRSEHPHGYGIGIAYPYIKQLQSCVEAGVCAAPGIVWEKLLDDAKGRLVYCSEDMLVRRHTKNKLSEGSIMDFSAVITTTRRDRDGDVLETKGAEPDPKMPLLWQHLPTEPIGRMVKIGTHNSKRLTARFAIADTPRGHDAATLIEMGALRISHGFRPIEVEPLNPGKDADEGDEFGGRGVRIKRFEVMETSLVSVPSNVDAVITAFSRDKLHDPLMKAWAGRQFEKRKTAVAVDALPAAMMATASSTTTSCKCHIPPTIEDLSSKLLASPVTENTISELTRLHAALGATLVNYEKRKENAKWRDAATQAGIPV